MTLSLLKRKSNEILICSWSLSCSWNFNKQTKTGFFGLVYTFKHKEQFWLLVVYFPSRQCLRVGPGKANMELYVPQSGPKSAGKVARARLKKPATRTWTINSIAVLLIQYVYMRLFQFNLIFVNLKRKLMGNCSQQLSWIILKVAWIHN